MPSWMAVFPAPKTSAHATCLPCNKVSARVVRARGVTGVVAQRRSHVGHLIKLMPCKAVSEPAAEDGIQGSKPKLSYEVLERAYIQQKLEHLNIQRTHQEAQAKLAQSEAIAEKALRICTKGAARSREASSRARLLQTKLDRLTSQTNVQQLQATVEEKEERFRYSQQEAESYRSKLQHTKEEKRHEASLKRIALAEKAKAQKEAQDLEAQRQQELQVYNEAINTGKVFGQVLFELFVKALSSTSVAATTSQKEKKGSKPKPEDERAKQQARFL